MQFEWDEVKRQTNLMKHGIDFIAAQQLFDGRPVATSRSTYPDELRFLTTGMIAERCITVIWTYRGEAIRIISARRARDTERRAHRALFE